MIKLDLLNNWIKKNGVVGNLITITYEYPIHDNNFNLLSIEGLNNWLAEVMKSFEVIEHNEWLSKSVLLDINIDYGLKSEDMVVKLSIIYPQFLNELMGSNPFEIKQNVCNHFLYDINDIDSYIHQYSEENLYDIINHSALFEHIWNYEPHLQQLNKEESIYLYSWGLFEIKQFKENDFYCNDWYLNSTNKTTQLKNV
jgi:hypothetical protein